MTNLSIATPVVSIINSQAITTSLEVARVFEKRHDHILRTIEQLRVDCGDEFNAPNFGAVEYKDEKGEFRKAYNLTRDGFTLLAMGFTGKRALQFKLAYIAQFNAMESALTLPTHPRPMSMRRWLVTFRDGQEHFQEIDWDDCLLKYSELPKLLKAPDNIISTELLESIATACIERLSNRCKAKLN